MKYLRMREASIYIHVNLCINKHQINSCLYINFCLAATRV